MSNMADFKLFNQEFNPRTIGIHFPLTGEEQKLASIVYSVTMEEVPRALGKNDSEHGFEFEEESSFQQEVSKSRFEASKGNLDQILKSFEQINGAREQFVENFEDWKLLRLENVRQLREIAEIIRLEKKRFSLGKLAGGVAGVVGGAAVAGALIFPPAAPALLPAWLGGAAVAAYVPAFLLPAAAPVIGPMAVGGGLAAGVGGAAMAGAVVGEGHFLNKRMNEAKEVLTADQLAFQYIEPWFRHTTELVNAVEAVMGFNAMQSWIKDLNTSLSWFKHFPELGDSKYDLFKSVIKLCIRRTLPQMEMLTGFGIFLAPVVITLLFVVFWLNRRNRFVFACVAKMQEMTSRLKRYLDQAELQRLIAAVGVKGAAVAELIALAMSRQLAMGAFAGVGFVFSIASVVLAGIDIKKGCNSNQAEEVEKVALKLQEEFDVLKEVYTNLTTMSCTELSICEL